MSDVITYPLSVAIELCEQLDNDETNYRLKMLEYKRERDEAREDAQKSKAYKRVLKVTNENLKRERDDAREALMKIEDLFIDGTDIYADREKMGMIARNALKETK
jgi:hypothetical protein